ncbi:MULTISPECIES: hypothetical protein [unclassified Methylobacterium]|uniref:hypothetical protein n=1 Tax=unclassified Methylobacterium TaxID=2615210 RepID=UPI000B14CEEA|nr:MULTISPECIES: hypothetical protein [unclassified Methylobacterium]MCJ2093717.1 hypothetical protein [Methylobacterium sp. J-072]MCJ2142207.1 hypothetical protein [Methylobacterium sp. E-066]
MLRKLGSILALVFGVATCFVIYSLIAGELATLPPDNAKLILDTERHTYASIPCAVRGQTDRELIVDRAALANPDSFLELPSFANEGTMGQIREEKRSGVLWKRDTTCEANGGFDVRWRLYQTEPKPRWTLDGDWRW